MYTQYYTERLPMFKGLDKALEDFSHIFNGDRILIFLQIGIRKNAYYILHEEEESLSRHKLIELFLNPFLSPAFVRMEQTQFFSVRTVILLQES